MSMPVRSDMVNGHHLPWRLHLRLADSRFAYACNSRNKNTVASVQHRLRGAGPAQRCADRRSAGTLAGRTGVYDITVSNQDGKPIALFRGKSYRIKGRSSPDCKQRSAGGTYQNKTTTTRLETP
jgi:acyl-CoA thioesterase